MNGALEKLKLKRQFKNFFFIQMRLRCSFPSKSLDRNSKKVKKKSDFKIKGS